MNNFVLTASLEHSAKMHMFAWGSHNLKVTTICCIHSCTSAGM